MQGITARDSDEQGNDDLCGINQPGSRTYADWDPAAVIDISSGAVSEGEEFAQVVVGIQGVTEEVLGSASMGQGLLGSFERELD